MEANRFLMKFLATTKATYAVRNKDKLEASKWQDAPVKRKKKLSLKCVTKMSGLPRLIVGLHNLEQMGQEIYKYQCWYS